MSDELLTIRQAALFLNVSETSLRRWTNAGVLASLRVGGRRERRFRREDLVAFMEDKPAAASPAPRAGTETDHGHGNAAPVSLGNTQLHPGAHLCGFYGSDAGRLRLAADFLADGIHDQGACFLVAQARVSGAVLARLTERLGAIEEHQAAGQLVVERNAATPQAQLHYWESRLGAALRAGARSLRVVVDMGGFSRRVSRAMLAEYEQAYEHQVARRFPVVTLCLYDARTSSGPGMLAALKSHTDLFRYFADHWLG